MEYIMQDRFETFTTSIFKIMHYWNRIATDEMKKHGLKGGYALYFVVISNHDGELSSADLAKLCGRDKADVSRAVSTLQKKGLLEMFEKGTYRAHLTFTPEGSKIADNIKSRASIAIDIAGHGLSDEMRNNMYQSLTVIGENLKMISEDGLPED